MNTTEFKKMPLGDFALEAYGDDLATSSDIEQMIPHWYAASLVLDKLGLVQSINSIQPSEKTAQELVEAAGVATYTGQHLFSVLDSLRAFSSSVAKLREAASSFPGDPVTALRKAAAPPMRWGSAEGPLHPWIVLAALAELRAEAAQPST
jgi:hypothetical protein